MKVKDLIEELSKFDPELPVVSREYDHLGLWLTKITKVQEISKDELENDPYGLWNKEVPDLAVELL